MKRAKNVRTELGQRPGGNSKRGGWERNGLKKKGVGGKRERVSRQDC